MQEQETFEVLARWDSEAAVWVAESDDIPGLVAEADSPNNLARKLKILIPELLELNSVPVRRTAKFHVRYESLGATWRGDHKSWLA